MRTQIARGDAKVNKHFRIVVKDPTEAIHEATILPPPGKKLTGIVTILPVLRNSRIILEVPLGQAWIGEDIRRQGKNWTRGRVVQSGINMPQLIPLPPRLVGFALWKLKDEAIVFPSDMNLFCTLQRYKTPAK